MKKFDLDIRNAGHRKLILAKGLKYWQEYAAGVYGYGGRLSYKIYRQAQDADIQHEETLREQLIREGVIRDVNTQLSLA